MRYRVPLATNLELDREKLWRFPAGLSLLALLVLPLVPWISRFEHGSSVREALAHLVALGVCSAMLGFGLGLWIGVRIRSPSTALTALGSVVVALLWWVWVFSPLIQDGVARFFETTDGWDAPIRDDRLAPMYPRHQQLTAAETAFVDTWLARVEATLI